MKWEHKIGVGITCTFLCLVGAVIGLKLREQPLPELSKAEVTDLEKGPVPTIHEDLTLSNSFDKSDSSPPGPTPPAPQTNTTNDASRRDGMVNNSSKQDDLHEPDAKKKVSEEISFFGNNGPSKIKDGATTQTGEKKKPAIVNASPPLAVEHNAMLTPVNGANQWGTPPPEAKEKKQDPAPALPKNDPKPASSAPPLAPGVNKPPTPNQPAPSDILRMSGMESPKAQTDAQPKPVVSPPSPAASTSSPPGKESTPPPPALGNAKNNAAAPQPALPPFMAQPSAPPPKASDPKEKDKTTPLTPTPVPVKPPEMVMPVPLSAPTPAPTVAPPLSPTPAPPASPLPLPTPTAAPPVSPIPSPAIVPGPVATPAPSAPSAPVTPASPAPLPKPPTEGSSFIPENPPATTGGPAGVRPALLPLPVPPSSSPLAATPEKLMPTPTPVRPASTGPSVTVYDEQDYSSRPGDTWEGVSKQFYMTDRYAKALQRHNQNHARASDRMKDNGQLAPGERIFVPQSYVLEDRYADAIAKPSAAPAPTATPATFVTPSGSTPPAPPAPRP